jgi:hypothetical protein
MERNELRIYVRDRLRLMNGPLSFSLVFSALLLPATPVWAHKPSDSYLTLRPTATNLVGEWHLALRDLDDALGLDANDDGVITWDELRARQPAVAAYAFARLHMSSEGQTGQLNLTGFLVDNHSDGAYAVIRFNVAGLALGSPLEIHYQAFFDIDPSHRGLLRLEHGVTPRLAVFGPGTATQKFVLDAPALPTAFPYIRKRRHLAHLGWVRSYPVSPCAVAARSFAPRRWRLGTR